VENPNEAAEQEFVGEVRLADRTRPGTYTVRDHDMRRPTYAFFAEAPRAAPPEAALEEYHYRPGAALVEVPTSGRTPAADDRGAARHEMDAGRLFAERALAGERADKRVIAYRTNVLDLWPGRVFTLRNHPHPDLGEARRLLVTCFTLEGTPGEAWTMRGEAVFADMPYHPPLRTPRLRARVQSATVVGNAGDEVHTDEFGRVRVRFPWDRGAVSSCWIRVGQGWAGPGYGMMTLPRVGQEVLVDFLEGDPEQPVIVGRSFNLTHPVIERLPERDTRSAWKSDSSPLGGGYNEILVEDLKGGELLRAQAERDARRLVKHDDTQTVVRDRAKEVALREEETTDGERVQETRGVRVERTARERDTAVEGTRRDHVLRAAEETLELDQLSRVGRDLHVVTAGERRERDEQDKHLRVEKGRSEAVRGTDSLTVREGLEEQVGSYVVNASGPEGTIHLIAGSMIVIESAADVTVKGAGGFVKTDGDVTLKGSEVVINEGGAPGSLPGPGPKRPAPPRRPEPPTAPPPPVSPPKDVYEVRVLDERDAPIAGLDVLITTPRGSQTVTTDGDGWARVRDVEGRGSARVASAVQFAELSQGWEARPRRDAPLPVGEAWSFQTPISFGVEIPVTSGKSAFLMVLTRTDIRFYRAYNPWLDPHLTGGGPFQFSADRDGIKLSLHSDGRGQTAVVACHQPRVVTATGEAPTEEVEWFRADVDALNEQNHGGDAEGLATFLAFLAREPPELQQTGPAPEVPEGGPDPGAAVSGGSPPPLGQDNL
jgi:type VI secretion system secreted protein VgrG